ncbi:MAG: hypothetical protein Fur006_09230 [Coleofasciculaceae cyanobacterium]
MLIDIQHYKPVTWTDKDKSDLSLSNCIPGLSILIAFFERLGITYGNNRAGKYNDFIKIHPNRSSFALGKGVLLYTPID